MRRLWQQFEDRIIRSTSFRDVAIEILVGSLEVKTDGNGHFFSTSSSPKDFPRTGTQKPGHKPEQSLEIHSCGFAKVQLAKQAASTALGRNLSPDQDLDASGYLGKNQGLTR